MNTRILIPSVGMVLTNGEVYSTEVYLGCNDNPENWSEITQEEYEQILKEQEEENPYDIYTISREEAEGQ